MPNTLMPFLYATRTILRPQFASSLRFTRSPQPRRALSSSQTSRAIPFVKGQPPKSPYGIEEEEAVPFEGPKEVDLAGSGIEELLAKTDNSTLTPNERQAFTDLWEKKLKGTLRPRDTAASSTLENAGPWRPEDSAIPIIQDAAPHEAMNADDTGEDYGSMLVREVPERPTKLSSRRLSTVAHWPGQNSENSDDLLSASMDLMSELQRESQRKLDSRKGREKEHAINKLREKDFRRFDVAMVKAQTDQEVWDILNETAFKPIAQLNLDDMLRKLRTQGRQLRKTNKTIAQKTRDEEVAQKLSVLGPNYPAYILRTVQILRNEFPTSSLPASIIPTVKSIGVVSFNLGATTQLYDELMAIAWQQSGEFEPVHQLLQEMTTAGLEYSRKTYDTLRAIQRQMVRESRDLYGVAAQRLSLMKQAEWDRERLHRWIAVVGESTDREMDRKKLEARHSIEIGSEEAQWYRDGPIR